MRRILGWLILAAIIAYAGYVGVHLIKLRLEYSAIKDKAEAMLQPTSTVRFRSIPDRLMEQAKERGIPLKEEDIQLVIDDWDNYKALSFAYTDTFLLFSRIPIYLRFSFTDTIPLNR
jgi:hypothetical protein